MIQLTNISGTAEQVPDAPLINVRVSGMMEVSPGIFVRVVYNGDGLSLTRGSQRLCIPIAELARLAGEFLAQPPSVVATRVNPQSAIPNLQS
jgi:hypothetical protein